MSLGSNHLSTKATCGNEVSHTEVACPAIKKRKNTIIISSFNVLLCALMMLFTKGSFLFAAPFLMIDSILSLSSNLHALQFRSSHLALTIYIFPVFRLYGKTYIVPYQYIKKSTVF
jgi:hypothetical protein